MRLVREKLPYRIEGGIDRTVACRDNSFLFAGNIKRECRFLRAFRAADNLKRNNLQHALARRHLIIHKRNNVIVKYVFLFVGEIFETPERIFNGVLPQIITKLFKLFAKCVTAGMLAHYQRGLGNANAFRRHDFIGLGVLQHPILMNAALMGKCILTDNGFVILHRESRDRGHQLRRARNHFAINAGFKRHGVTADFERHNDLLKRRISRPLADSVNRAFNLARTTGNTGQRIRNRQTQIIVAMGRDHSLVDVWNT